MLSAKFSQIDTNAGSEKKKQFYTKRADFIVLSTEKCQNINLLKNMIKA